MMDALRPAVAQRRRSDQLCLVSNGGYTGAEEAQHSRHTQLTLLEPRVGGRNPRL